MSQVELDKIREGVRSILLGKFCSVVGKAVAGWKSDPPVDKELIKEFEKSVYNQSVVNWRAGGKTGGKGPFKQEYVKLYNAATAALAHSPGPFPDQVLAVRLLHRTISPKDAATNEILFDHENRNPRDIYRKLFVASFLNEPRISGDRQKALDLATRIETSCYRATITASKNAENPYRRNWNSEPFKALYSGRCATVNSHIDPQGSVVHAYGSELMNRILSDGASSISPDAVGNMTAAQMCPDATRIEKMEIEIRQQQHVVEKYSEMFRCPECKKSACTYIEKQSRSLDEPAKIICKCICGRKFIGSG